MGWETSWFRLKRKKATAVPPLGSIRNSMCVQSRMVSVCIRVVGFELKALVGDLGDLMTAGRAD